MTFEMMTEHTANARTMGEIVVEPVEGMSAPAAPAHEGH
jgi:hypothetical protein